MTVDHVLPHDLDDLYGVGAEHADDIVAVEYKVQVIQPKQDCPNCHGTGEVDDWVPRPFGGGSVAMPSLCSCVEEQTDEDTDEVLLDLDYDTDSEGYVVRTRRGASAVREWRLR